MQTPDKTNTGKYKPLKGLPMSLLQQHIITTALGPLEYSSCIEVSHDSRFVQIGFWWRYGLNMERFAEVCLENWPRIWAMRWFMPAGIYYVQ